MPKHRTIEEAEKTIAAATDQVIEQGEVVQEAALFDAAEAALDGRPTKYLAEIISGKREGPYVPSSGWRPGRSR